MSERAKGEKGTGSARQRTNAGWNVSTRGANMQANPSKNEKWTKERCKDAQRTYRDEQLDPIVDMFVAAFANSNKAIKDGYDSQIKQYDHMLNGYTKQTSNGKKHFFGAAEISQMFESATPELLRKIAGVIAEHGCKDVKEWMQKSPWYREFELGRETEKKLRMEREWER